MPRLEHQEFWDRMKQATQGVEDWPDWEKGTPTNERLSKPADLLICGFCRHQQVPAETLRRLGKDPAVCSVCGRRELHIYRAVARYNS